MNYECNGVRAESIAPYFSCVSGEVKNGNTETHAVLSNILVGRFAEEELAEICISLVREFAGLSEIFRASRKRLRAIAPWGDIVFEELARLRKLATIFSRAELTQRGILNNCEKIASFCRLLMSTERREVFHLLLLDKQMALIKDLCLQEGTVDHVSVYPREVFRVAFEYAASSVVLIHNHPGGNATPSAQDIKMTKTLARLGWDLGVQIADHIIIGKNDEFSFRRDGYKQMLVRPMRLHSSQVTTLST